MRALLFALLLFQESLEQRRDRLASRLEEIRGLKFKEKLRIREGTRREYAGTALESVRILYGGNLTVAEQFLKFLGFIPIRMRLDLAVTAGAALGVPAYCSGGEVVVLDPKTPDDLLLNKMALGLLEQHYPEADLRKRAATSFDSQMALSAIRSGDADVSKVLLWFSKKGAEKISDDWLDGMVRTAEKWEREESKLKSAIFPRIFVRSGDFGWRRGAVFVETLRLKGGMALVDKAYERPPLSTEQILHPAKYLAGEAPVIIDLASTEEHLRGLGFGVTYRTTLGEFGTAVLLETHLRNHDSGPPAAGWAGDTIALFEGNGIAFTVWATEWDSERDAEEFQAALAKLSQQLLPAERARTNFVLRRRTAVAWLFNVPVSQQERLTESLWKCRKEGQGAYGE